MSAKRYPEDFKIKAVKQVTDRGYKIADVAQRLGVARCNEYAGNGSELWPIPAPTVRYIHQTV
mgnify:CR=1 FL=1|jgi:hypothetical protein